MFGANRKAFILTRSSWNEARLDTNEMLTRPLLLSSRSDGWNGSLCRGAGAHFSGTGNGGPHCRAGRRDREKLDADWKKSLQIYGTGQI